MTDYNTHIARLCQSIEKTCGRRMQTPKDFDLLSASIFSTTRNLVNVSTLKRIFGYVKSEGCPRESTLNILCQYVGYTDWATFCQQSVESESDIIVSQHIHTRELSVGTRIRLMWKPNRVVEVAYQGQGVFRILSSENSKLPEGATFRCSVFIQNEPLFLTDVTGLAETPVDYVCGQDNGILFTIM